jgi:hypothetical protein
MRSIEKRAPFEYKLNRVIPSQEFTGMGTVWWLANDVRGTSLVIEETWRFADQQSGVELLDLIRGVDGVGEVLACEESFNTFQFRGPGSASTPVRPRVRFRIVFKGYENAIDKFKTRNEFLNGFRDVVAGTPYISTLLFTINSCFCYTIGTCGTKAFFIAISVSITSDSDRIAPGLRTLGFSLGFIMALLFAGVRKSSESLITV